MRKTLMFTVMIMVVGWLWSVGTYAQNITPMVKVTDTVVPTMAPTIMDSEENLVEGERGEGSDELGKLVREKEVGKWNGVNSMRKLVRFSIDRGVAANTIVLLLLLPLIATVVSVLHYIVGVTGYGIFTPTMVAVTFLATGIFGGLALFAIILGISIAANWMLKKLKIHFWPARSVGLVFISLGTFGLMIITSYFELFDLTKISIFPVLLMILLAEDFVRTQLVKSKSEAKKLTIGTLVLSMVGAMAMSIRGVQEWVILNPEIIILLVVVINLAVGNYSGIRMTEIVRFKGAIREKGVSKKLTK